MLKALSKPTAQVAGYPVVQLELLAEAGGQGCLAFAAALTSLWWWRRQRAHDLWTL